MPELKADKVLLDQVALRSNIKIKKNVATKQIVAENGHVTAIEYQDRATEDVQSLPLAGVFIQIGLVPNSAFLKGLVELTKYGEVVVNDRCQTSESGVFACGDVTTVPYKQIIISMGEGAKAALSAFEYILKHDTSSQRSGGQKQDSAVSSVA
jgi:alkyl hydroperoxide reductase subunit F